MDGAIRDGKIVQFSAEEIEKMDLKTFSAHVEKLEAGKVPMEKRTPEGVKTFSAADAKPGFNDSMQRMGLSKEDFEKYGPKD
jgi:hypothetical protein